MGVQLITKTVISIQIEHGILGSRKSKFWGIKKNTVDIGWLHRNIGSI